MKLLRTYVLTEHAGPFFTALGALTGVLIMGNLLKFAELVIAKGVSPFDLLRLLIYLLPYMVSFTLPMACLIGMVLALGRLSADSELIAIRACGVPPWRLAVPLVTVAAIISGVLLVLNSRLVPESHLAFRRQIKAIGLKQPAAYLEAGTFIKDFPPYVIFVYQVQGQTLHNIRIYEPQPNGPTRTIIADRGRLERAPNQRQAQLKLFNGTLDEWDPANPGAFYKAAFTTYVMTLRSDEHDPERLGKKLKELTLRELVGERKRLVAEGVDALPVSLELHRRIAASFAPLVFALFGLAFGLQRHHHERLIVYLWVLAVFIAYYLGMVGMNAAAMKAWLPASLAMWMPNVLGGAVGGALALRGLRQ